MLGKLSEHPNVSITPQGQEVDAPYLDLNATKAPYPLHPLHDLVYRQAKTTPAHTALIFKGNKTSYARLQTRCNQLAHYLVRAGIEQGDLIGVCLPRSAELPIVLLAISQCGAAFVPLDPNYPKTRLEFMLDDAEAKCLITTKGIATSLRFDQDVLDLEEITTISSEFPETPLQLDVSINGVAYQIYTSGSTGKPKGIRATHKNLVNFLWSMLEAPGIQETDRLLSITTSSFDPIFLELFLPLIKGALIVLADDESARDGRMLLDLMRSHDISILQATPTTWKMLIDAGWKKPLGLKALCGGEALTLGLARQLHERCAELWNIYGPTETTVWSTIKRIEVDDTLITIGKPIANVQVYLLDKRDELVAPGAVGEIIIGGDGVTLGYWRRRELTSKNFVANPFAKNKKQVLYRTGDLGKLLPNGEIQCLGRIDQQVKIRGHRIEPGEIEQALVALPEIRAAAVLAHADRLIAFTALVEPAGFTEEKITSWRKRLSEELPSQLIPHEFISMHALPKTPNGKTDRKALIELATLKVHTRSHTGPRTVEEKVVAEIWQACLELDPIDIFSNFFELGGHSITAVRVMTKLEERTGKRLPLAALMEYPTIEQFALLLKKDMGGVGSDYLVPIKPNGNKTPLYMVHGAGLNVLVFNELAHGMSIDQPVFGIQASDLLSDLTQQITVEELASNYVRAILAKDPKGPYALAGYSFGGFIAYEMARQFTQEGKKVKALALLDTYVELPLFQSNLLRKRLARLKYEATRLSHLVMDMCRSWSNFTYHLDRKRRWLLEKRRYAKEESAQELAEWHAYQRMEKKVNEIMKHYQITPQPVKIDLFRVSENTKFMHDDEYLGWKNLALNGIQVHPVPGDHLQMLSSSNAKVIAKKLEAVLAQLHP